MSYIPQVGDRVRTSTDVWTVTAVGEEYLLVRPQHGDEQRFQIKLGWIKVEPWVECWILLNATGGTVAVEYSATKAQERVRRWERGIKGIVHVKTDGTVEMLDGSPR